LTQLGRTIAFSATETSQRLHHVAVRAAETIGGDE
jgi:hypothetical protein